jgi:hypothetical protein
MGEIVTTPSRPPELKGRCAVSIKVYLHRIGRLPDRFLPLERGRMPQQRQEGIDIQNSRDAACTLFPHLDLKLTPGATIHLEVEDENI